MQTGHTSGGEPKIGSPTANWESSIFRLRGLAWVWCMAIHVYTTDVGLAGGHIPNIRTQKARQWTGGEVKRAVLLMFQLSGKHVWDLAPASRVN